MKIYAVASSAVLWEASCAQQLAPVKSSLRIRNSHSLNFFESSPSSPSSSSARSPPAATATITNESTIVNNANPEAVATTAAPKTIQHSMRQRLFDITTPTATYSPQWWIDWDYTRCVQDCSGPPPCGDRVRDSWEDTYEIEECCDILYGSLMHTRTGWCADKVVEAVSPTVSPSAIPSNVAPNTLTNQIICGYQGWFAYPGDGAPINRWKHWFSNPANVSAPVVDEELTVDLYPAVDEYDNEDLIETGIPMNDGSYAKFYSSVKPKVVLKHFEWMETYGITGVFHMRFMESLNFVKNREWKTMVLMNVKNAAEATGRAFAVSYNIAGRTLNNDVLDDLKADWIRLVDEEQITQSDRYIRQEGLPVLRIYGIGFKAVNVDDTNRMADLIDWFQNTADEKYRVFLIGGVPSRWRTRVGDSREESEWENIYDSLNGIHPWHVGRWRTIAGFDRYHSNTISLDAEHCNDKGILYMPTMWPGFSWHNLMKRKSRESSINSIPRLGGNFMWRQAFKYAADSNINTIWMAQFDEVDEGTAIYKVAATESHLPAEGNWLALDADGQSLPSDWYLRLCGEAQKMLEGKIGLSTTINIQLPAPTNSPTTSPSFEPTPTEVIATFDDLGLRVPKCSVVGSSCTSGPLLLDGKASNIEPNPSSSNTLDDCTDGRNGAYHDDESIDEITVYTIEGGPLQGGATVEIEAKVWAWRDGSADTADFYFAADANAPNWQYIGSVGAGGFNLRTLTVQYTLPYSDGTLQAVRVNYRYGGSTNPCTRGSWNDVDDLVFSVAAGSATAVASLAAYSKKPLPVPPAKPLPSSHCATIDKWHKDRCDENPVCKWKNGRGKGKNGRGKGCHPKNHFN